MSFQHGIEVFNVKKTILKRGKEIHIKTIDPRAIC